MDRPPRREDLEQICRKWQKILRLQDWRIRIRWARKGEIGGALAKVRPTYERKIAEIGVCHPSDLTANEKIENDPIEFSVIHELLHLYFEGLGIAEEKEVNKEAAIDCIASAFFNLTNKGPDPWLTDFFDCDYP